jgi:hypothetical protein
VGGIFRGLELFERDYQPEARRWMYENVKMRHYVHSIPKFGFAPWSHGGNTIP